MSKMRKPEIDQDGLELLLEQLQDLIAANMPEVLDDEGAAELLGVKRHKLQRMIQDDKLPCHMIGNRTRRFIRTELLKWSCDRAAHESCPDSKTALEWADEVIARFPAGTHACELGNVYFVSDGNGVKVGFSKTIRSRMISLQIGNPSEVELLCSFKGNRAHEKHLHAALASDRIRGEWFRRSNKVEALITRLGG